MSGAINLLAAFCAFLLLCLGGFFLAGLLRTKWRYRTLRIWIDLSRVNVWTQFILLTNPQQNALLIYGGLCFLYFILAYVARPGGMGRRLLGKKSKIGTHTKVIKKRVSHLLWWFTIVATMFLGHGTFMGEQMSSPSHYQTARIDLQHHLGFDPYQQHGMSIVLPRNKATDSYTTVRVDVNLDNQVDIGLMQQEDGTYTRNILLYGPQKRYFLYILCLATLLALGAMRLKSDRITGQFPTQGASSQLQQQMLVVGALLLPVVGLTVSLPDLQQQQYSYQDCLTQQAPQACEQLAKLLAIDPANVKQPGFQKKLHTYLQLQAACDQQGCTPEQQAFIHASYRTWLEEIAPLAEVHQALIQSDKQGSFYTRLNELPTVTSELLDHLTTNQQLNQVVRHYQQTKDLDTTHRTLLHEALSHDRLRDQYHHLLALTNMSIHFSADNLRSGQLSGSTLVAQDLLQLQKLSPTTNLHQAYLSLNRDSSLSEHQITVHLFVAQTIAYLAEKNPIFPLWSAVGWSFDRLGRDRLRYQRGYTANEQTVYLTYAHTIMQRNSAHLQETINQQRTSLSNLLTTTTTDSVWTKGKKVSYGLVNRGRLSGQLAIRSIIKRIDKIHLLQELNKAHIDLLLDIAR